MMIIVLNVVLNSRFLYKKNRTKLKKNLMKNKKLFGDLNEELENRKIKGSL